MTTTKDEAIKLLREALETLANVADSVAHDANTSMMDYRIEGARNALAATSHIAPDVPVGPAAAGLMSHDDWIKGGSPAIAPDAAVVAEGLTQQKMADWLHERGDLVTALGYSALINGNTMDASLDFLTRFGNALLAGHSVTGSPLAPVDVKRAAMAAGACKAESLSQLCKECCDAGIHACPCVTQKTAPVAGSPISPAIAPEAKDAAVSLWNATGEQLQKADDTLRNLSSYVGQGGCWDTENLDYAEMGARIKEGIDSITKVENKRAIAPEASELPPLKDIDLTYAIARKVAEFYPQETPRDMEKNHRLARAIQRLPLLHQTICAAIAMHRAAAAKPDALDELVNSLSAEDRAECEKVRAELLAMPIERVINMVQGNLVAAEPVPTDLPTNDEVYAEVCRERGKLTFYVSTNAVNDVMAAVRRLTTKPAASEAVGVPDAYMVVWKGEPVDLYFQKFNAEQKVRSMDAEASIVPLRSILAAPAAPTDAKPHNKE